MSMKRTSLLILLCFVMLIALGQDVQSFQKENISFDLPAEWEVKDIPDFHILVGEKAREEVSVMTTFDVAVEPGFSNLEAYCGDYEGKMMTNEQFKEFTIRSKQAIDFHGFDAMDYHCSASVYSLPIEWRSVIFMHKGKVYKLSTTTTADRFETMRERLDGIFRSFRMKD